MVYKFKWVFEWFLKSERKSQNIYLKSKLRGAVFRSEILKFQRSDKTF